MIRFDSIITLNVFANVEAVDESRPAGGREKARQHRHGRGLSGSVVAEQGRDLALVHVEVDVIDGQFAFVVLFGQPFDLNSGPKSDRLLFDVLGVAGRPLGAGQRNILGGHGTAAPIVPLQRQTFSLCWRRTKFKFFVYTVSGKYHG